MEDYMSKLTALYRTTKPVSSLLVHQTKHANMLTEFKNLNLKGKTKKCPHCGAVVAKASFKRHTRTKTCTIARLRNEIKERQEQLDKLLR